MPPALAAENESETESAAEKVLTKKDDVADSKMKEAEDEDEDQDEDEVYVVESILDHRSDFEDGEMRYWVKWKGYEKKADRTWELEEAFENAREILEEYWKSIGGKPVPGAPKSSKKRGRQSVGETKKPETSKRRKSKKSNGLEQDQSPNHLVGFSEEGDDDWKAPPPKDGAWDPLVQSVDTVVRENADGELWGYLIWNEKNDDGRFYRSKAKLPTIYRACPQRMLHFYEKHLVFSTQPNDADKGEN